MRAATVHKLTPRRERTEHRAHDRAPKLVFDKRTDAYRIVYYPDPASSERRFISTKTNDPKEAARIMERERDRIGSVRRGHEVETTTAQARITVEEILARLVTDYETEQRSALRSLKSNVKNRLVPEFGKMRADALTTLHVKEARTRWLKSGIEDGTCYRHIAALRRAYALAVEDGKLARMPAVRWPSYDQHKTARQVFVTVDELRAVNAAEPVAAARDMNSWGYLTGMRYGEIAGLTWNHYDPEAHAITLSAEDTKTDEPRTIPIPDALPELSEILARRRTDRRPGCAFIFHHKGKPLTRPERWARAWKRAGLPMKTAKHNPESKYAPPAKVFHDLRRTAVRNLRLAGVDRRVIKLISGHKSDVIFERHYNAIDAVADVRAGLASLGTWMRAGGLTRPASAPRSSRGARATKSASSYGRARRGAAV